MSTEDDKLNLPSGFYLDPRHTVASQDKPHKVVLRHNTECARLLWQLCAGATYNDYILSGSLPPTGPSAEDLLSISRLVWEVIKASARGTSAVAKEEIDGWLHESDKNLFGAWCLANQRVLTPTNRTRRGSLRRLAELLVRVMQAQNLPTGPLSIGPSIAKALRHIGGSPDNLHEKVQHELIAEIVSLVDPSHNV